MRRGVLLFNLGGPETLDDIKPFLYNLFSDPDIIRIKNGVLRRTLTRIISTLRHEKSKALYRQIGGGSPLRRITDEQARALAAALESKGRPTATYVGMRCWKPSIDDAVEQMLRDGIEELVLLPLFPQYSVTTTGSCLKYFESLAKNLGLSSKMRIATVREWFSEPLYIKAMAGLIREAADGFPPDEEELCLLYSAHSLPASYVEKGDPYFEQTKETVELINAELGRKHSFRLSFQSKVGPVRWLGPATRDVLLELGRNGTRRVVVVPVSFVSDHIETLQEIDISYRDLALGAGIKDFRRAAALNTHPVFIEALTAIVLNASKH